MCITTQGFNSILNMVCNIYLIIGKVYDFDLCGYKLVLK